MMLEQSDINRLILALVISTLICIFYAWLAWSFRDKIEVFPNETPWQDGKPDLSDDDMIWREKK